MSQGSSRRFTPSVWHIALILPLFAIGFIGRVPIRDNSFLWHVTAGNVQLQGREVLTTDPFSFTKFGEPWRTQSWLAELGYGILDARWGLSFVPWMVWFLAAVFMTGMLLIAFRSSRSVPATAAFGVLTILLAIAFLNPRPVIYSFALFPLLVLAEQDQRARWSTPLLLWLWASLHGSFVIGGVYIVLQSIRRRRWDAWKELAASGVAVSLTAHGWGVWQLLLEFGQSREALDAIAEWATPDLVSLPMLPLFLAIIALIWGGMKGRIAPRDLIVIVPFLALALSANRAVPPAWIALAPFVAAAIADLKVHPRPVSSLLGRVNSALIAVLMVGPLLVPPVTKLDGERFPVDAATNLTSDRVFHDDATGGYLIYAQWPERLVYVDDRAELYGDMITEFLSVRGGRTEWQEVFDRYAIDEVLLPPQQALVETLRLAGWGEAYRDESFVIMRPVPGS